MHLIKEIISAEPYKLKLKFNTGEIKTIDLEPKLNEWSKTPDSKFKELLKPEFFVNVKYNNEMESIYWDNGIDLCPDVLYKMDMVEA